MVQHVLPVQAEHPAGAGAIASDPERGHAGDHIARAEVLRRVTPSSTFFRYLLGDTNKQRACQSAVFTGERCIIGVIVSAEYGGIPAKRALFD